MTWPNLTEAIVWIAAGTALGTVYLYLIGRTVAAIAQPSGGGQAAGYLLLRFALAVAAFAFAVRQGAAAPLLMLAGFMLARTVALRWVGGPEHGR